MFLVSDVGLHTLESDVSLDALNWLQASDVGLDALAYRQVMLV